MLQERAGHALPAINVAQLGALLLGLLFDLLALGRDTVREEIMLGPGRKVAAQEHRDPAGGNFRESDQEKGGMSLGHRAGRDDEHEGGNQAIVESEYDIAEPATSMRMLLLGGRLRCRRRVDGWRWRGRTTRWGFHQALGARPQEDPPRFRLTALGLHDQHLERMRIRLFLILGIGSGVGEARVRERAPRLLNGGAVGKQAYRGVCHKLKRSVITGSRGGAISRRSPAHGGTA